MPAPFHVRRPAAAVGLATVAALGLATVPSGAQAVPRAAAHPVAAPAPVAATSAPRTTRAARATVHRTVLVGWSVQHRPIRAYELGDPSASRTVLVLGQMHGNEKGGVNTVAAMLADPRPVKGIRLWVIPTLNPDGYRHDTRHNAHGVDLNRNFPQNWSRSTPFAGPRAASEPETRALEAFLLKQRPALVVSLHQPFGAVDAYHVKDHALQHRLMRNLHLGTTVMDCKGGCHGTMVDWFDHHLPGAAITVEYTARASMAYETRTARDGIIAALGGRH